LISTRRMEIWAVHFPEFAEAIHRKLAEDRHKWDSEEQRYETITDLHFNPGEFAIFGFGDCSDLQICTPMLGPKLAGCNWCEMQAILIYSSTPTLEDIMNGMHWSLCLTLCLMESLQVFGPCWRNDQWVLNWSDLDAFFRALNEHFLGIHNSQDLCKAYYDNGICGPVGHKMLLWLFDRNRRIVVWVLRGFLGNGHTRMSKCIGLWFRVQIGPSSSKWILTFNRFESYSFSQTATLVSEAVPFTCTLKLNCPLSSSIFCWWFLSSLV
jgi:hypothetical protein